MEILKAAEAHLTSVQLERSHYRQQCKSCKTNLHSTFTESSIYTPFPLFPSLHSVKPSTVHLSFDMPQQVFLVEEKVIKHVHLYMLSYRFTILVIHSNLGPCTS